MASPCYSSEETPRRGEDIYEHSLRSAVETEENIGKIIAIDVESGDYAIDSVVIAAGDQLYAKHPDAAIWTRRIGYNAVYAVGGSLYRTAK